MELQNKLEKELNNKLQDLDDKLENYLVTINKNIEKSNSIDSDTINKSISSLTSKCSTLEESLNSTKTELQDTKTTLNNTIAYANNIEMSVNTVSGYADSLNTKIENNQKDIGYIRNDINGILDQVGKNVTDIENLKSMQTQTDQEYFELTSDVNDLKTRVTNLEENQGSGGTTDLTEITNKVSNIENITNNFIRIIKDRNKALDPTYTPIDQDTVVQTYDFMERKYDSYSTSSHSGIFTFIVNQNSTSCKLKITIHIQGDSDTGQGRFNLYFNSPSTITDTQEFTYDTTTRNITFTFEKNLTSVGNSFKFYANTSNSTKMHFDYAKVEVLECTNPIFLNNISPFDVEYFDGKYYLTDCTGDYAKIAEIGVNDIVTMNDITWTTTTFNAISSCITTKYKTGVSPYKITSMCRMFLLANGKVIFYDADTDTTQTYNEYFCSTLQPIYTNNLYFQAYCRVSITNSLNDVYRVFCTSTSVSHSANNNTANPLANIIGSRYVLDYFSGSTNSNCVVQQHENGQFTVKNSSKSILIEDPGIVMNMYVEDEKLTTYNVYVKKYDKIIKYNFKYASGSIQCLETSVVGNYENYFEGVNNDYFTVKDNQLHYYKEILQNVDNIDSNN